MAAGTKRPNQQTSATRRHSLHRKVGITAHSLLRHKQARAVVLVKTEGHYMVRPQRAWIIGVGPYPGTMVVDVDRYAIVAGPIRCPGKIRARDFIAPIKKRDPISPLASGDPNPDWFLGLAPVQVREINHAPGTVVWREWLPVLPFSVMFEKIP